MVDFIPLYFHSIVLFPHPLGTDGSQELQRRHGNLRDLIGGVPGHCEIDMILTNTDISPSLSLSVMCIWYIYKYIYTIWIYNYIQYIYIQYIYTYNIYIYRLHIFICTIYIYTYVGVVYIIYVYCIIYIYMYIFIISDVLCQQYRNTTQAITSLSVYIYIYPTNAR